MAITLGQFHSLVSAELRRGTVHDAVIPDYVRRAARWMERNHTFQYMRRFQSLTIDADATEPRAITLPCSSTLFKGITFFRLVPDDGDYIYLTKIDPRSVSTPEPDDDGTPKAYWLDGLDYIWLDRAPEEDYNAEMYSVQYTDWPTDTSVSTLWLLNSAEDVMIAQTILQMGPLLRDDQSMGRWKAIRDEALRTLLLAEEEVMFSNEVNVMKFGVKY